MFVNVWQDCPFVLNRVVGFHDLNAMESYGEKLNQEEKLLAMVIFDSEYLLFTVYATSRLCKSLRGCVSPSVGPVLFSEDGNHGSQGWKFGHIVSAIT